MNRMSLHLLGLGALGLALVGCTSQTKFHEGPSTDVFHLPPENDPHFTQPPEYPKDTLNQGIPKRSFGGMGGGPGGGMGPMGGARAGGGMGPTGGPGSGGGF